MDVSGALGLAIYVLEVTIAACIVFYIPGMLTEMPGNVKRVVQWCVIGVAILSVLMAISARASGAPAAKDRVIPIPPAPPPICKNC